MLTDCIVLTIQCIVYINLVYQIIETIKTPRQLIVAANLNDWQGLILILFISYTRVQQQDVVCQNTPKLQNTMWPTIQIHGRQIHDYIVSITLVHSVTGHSVVRYHKAKI